MRVIRCLLLSALVLLLLPLPYFWLDYHPGYILLILIGPVPLLIGVIRVLSWPAPDWGRIQRRFKWIMLAGMASIFMGIYG